VAYPQEKNDLQWIQTTKETKRETFRENWEIPSSLFHLFRPLADRAH
jgi:hypothetical protein